MPSSSTTPSGPTPGSSPLVELLPSSTTEIHIIPGFGNRLQVVLHSTEGMPEPMPGAVEAVTVYGDGRIEYHPISAPTTPCHTNADGHRMVNDHCLYCGKSQSEVRS